MTIDLKKLQSIFDGYFNAKHPRDYAEYVIIKYLDRCLEKKEVEATASEFFGEENHTVSFDEFPYLENAECLFTTKECVAFDKEGNDYLIYKKAIVFTIPEPRQTKSLYMDAVAALKVKLGKTKEELKDLEHLTLKVKNFYSSPLSFYPELSFSQHPNFSYLKKYVYEVSRPFVGGDDLLVEILESISEDFSKDEIKTLFSKKPSSDEEWEELIAKFAPHIQVSDKNVEEAYGESNVWIEDILKDYLPDIFKHFEVKEEDPIPEEEIKRFSNYTAAKKFYDDNKNIFPAFRLYETEISIDGTVVSQKLLESNKYFEN